MALHIQNNDQHYTFMEVLCHYFLKNKHRSLGTKHKDIFPKPGIFSRAFLLQTSMNNLESGSLSVLPTSQHDTHENTRTQLLSVLASKHSSKNTKLSRGQKKGKRNENQKGTFVWLRNFKRNKRLMRPNHWNPEMKDEMKLCSKPEFCSLKAYAFMEILLYKGQHWMGMRCISTAQINSLSFIATPHCSLGVHTLRSYWKNKNRNKNWI